MPTRSARASTAFIAIPGAAVTISGLTAPRRAPAAPAATPPLSSLPHAATLPASLLALIRPAPRPAAPAGIPARPGAALRPAA